MIKTVVATFAVIYLLCGVAYGEALHQSIPAINLAGASYAAVTWPLWIKGSPIQLPIPDWAFTFNDVSK